MSRPSKLLFVGVAGAILTVGVGWLGTARTERELSTLQQSCEKEGGNDPTGFRLECDPQVLNSLDRRQREQHDRAIGTGTVVEYKPSPGIQGELIRTQRRLEAWQSIPFDIAAATVAALCALPWLWYFLLARIRELSAAIRGTGTGGG